jgi:hypothetical protein
MIIVMSKALGTCQKIQSMTSCPSPPPARLVSIYNKLTGRKIITSATTFVKNTGNSQQHTAAVRKNGSVLFIYTFKWEWFQ